MLTYFIFLLRHQSKKSWNNDLKFGHWILDIVYWHLWLDKHYKHWKINKRFVIYLSITLLFIFFMKIKSCSSAFFPSMTYIKGPWTLKVLKGLENCWILIEKESFIPTCDDFNDAFLIPFCVDRKQTTRFSSWGRKLQWLSFLFSTIWFWQKKHKTSPSQKRFMEMASSMLNSLLRLVPLVFLFYPSWIPQASSTSSSLLSQSESQEQSGYCDWKQSGHWFCHRKRTLPKVLWWCHAHIQECDTWFECCCNVGIWRPSFIRNTTNWTSHLRIASTNSGIMWTICMVALMCWSIMLESLLIMEISSKQQADLGTCWNSKRPEGVMVVTMLEVHHGEDDILRRLPIPVSKLRTNNRISVPVKWTRGPLAEAGARMEFLYLNFCFLFFFSFFGKFFQFNGWNNS